jgi:hypothetical protein
MALAAVELLAVAESRRNPTTAATPDLIDLLRFSYDEVGRPRPTTRQVPTDERPPAASLRAVAGTGRRPA